MKHATLIALCSVAGVLVMVLATFALSAGVLLAGVPSGPGSAQPQAPPRTLVVSSEQQPFVVSLARPSQDRWDHFARIAQAATPFGSLLGFLGVIVTVLWGVRNAKLTYFTKEWSTLMQFLHTNARFMERQLTTTYRTGFTGEDATKYELVARLCIGYLDDLYFLRSRREIRSWFRGSVKLLAGTHQAWLEDHRDSYDEGFYDFIMRELRR